MPDRKRNWDKTPQAYAYRNQYNSEHYDRFSLLLPGGMKSDVSAVAKAAGMSINAYIIEAIRDKMKSAPENPDSPENPENETQPEQA